MTTPQLGLFAIGPRGSLLVRADKPAAPPPPALPRDRIQERFEQWLRDNPQAYALFVRFARDAKQAGAQHYSADAILHRLRWHVDVELRSAEQWRVNNDHASRLAREAMRREPDLAGFFELRDLGCERSARGGRQS